MSSQYDDLEKLADLKNKGIITEEEFNKQKAKILNIHNSAASSEISRSSNEKTSKLGNNSVGTLVIVRPSSMSSTAFMYNITIDENKVGKVSNGETFSASLPVGQHKVLIQADYDDSKLFSVGMKMVSKMLFSESKISSSMPSTFSLINISEGQTVKFKLHIGLGSVKLKPL